MTNYKLLAIKYYTGHKDYNKAIAAGVAIDNALKKEYSPGGSTNTHFMINNYFKYFSYEALTNKKLI